MGAARPVICSCISRTLTGMSKINYSPDMDIGIPVLDEQHRKLFLTVGRIEELAHKHGKAEMVVTLEDLAAQAKLHFETEERLMAAYEFPEHHFRASHNQLLEGINRLVSHFGTEERRSYAKTLSAVKHWLLLHVDEDKRLGSFLNSPNAIVNVVNQIILNAHDSGASDIHIDAYPGR